MAEKGRVQGAGLGGGGSETWGAQAAVAAALSAASPADNVQKCQQSRVKSICRSFAHVCMQKRLVAYGPAHRRARTLRCGLRWHRCECAPRRLSSPSQFGWQCAAWWVLMPAHVDGELRVTPALETSRPPAWRCWHRSWAGWWQRSALGGAAACRQCQVTLLRCDSAAAAGAGAPCEPAGCSW